MKIWIHTPYDKLGFFDVITKLGIEIDPQRPDFIITYGGDGTILYSEQAYPGIPKIPILRHREFLQAKYYPKDQLSSVLKKVQDGKFKLDEKAKVEAFTNVRRIFGLNEVQVRTKVPYKMLRFDVTTPKKKYDTVMGDGVMIATPYGSTAYYSNLGHKPFKDGLKLAFNNCNIRPSPIGIDDIVQIKVKRGPGVIIADNNPNVMELKQDSVVTIRRAKTPAKFVVVR
ncbi:MAG: NAD(+)/NADH kinase [Deltaproteobacteria bacterium]|nr:NAD(+)/NADH kinase [Deltaproteobacteria bacterium]